VIRTTEPAPADPGLIRETRVGAALRWFRVHFFRFWTACAVLGAYVYLWLNRPEYLTWWKRTVEALIEAGCSRLPYPWGDQIESTIGNIGLWMQVTLAILIFRTLLGLLLMLIRGSSRRRRTPRIVPEGNAR
jgi:hypothetical protein